MGIVGLQFKDMTAAFFPAALLVALAACVLNETCDDPLPPPPPLPQTAAPSPTGTSLVVTVEGLRNHKGVLAVSLFRGAEGFPDDDSRAWAKQVVSIAPPTGTKTVSLRFNQLPPGQWAVVLLHDENKNSRMDTGLFGIPKEGFGASNNPKVRTGPPRFRDASFTIAPGETVHTIAIKPVYMGHL